MMIGTHVPHVAILVKMKHLVVHLSGFWVSFIRDVGDLKASTDSLLN